MPRTIVVLFALLLALAACAEADPAAEPAPATQAPAATEAPATTMEHSMQEEEHSMEEGEHAEGDDHAEEGHSGEEEHDSMASGDARVVEVVLTEFVFEPASFEAKVGETVRFVITNNGAVEHELRLSNAHRIEEHIASGHEDHGDEGHHGEDGDFVVVVAAGETVEAEFTFPEDTTLYTEVACLIPGHYEAGMTAPLTVTAA